MEARPSGDLGIMKPFSSAMPTCSPRSLPPDRTRPYHPAIPLRGRMETRRILLDGAAVATVPDGDDLVAGDGRRVPAAQAVYLPPVVPTKIVCVHLNYRSR